MQQKMWIGFIFTLIIVIFIPVYWAMEPGRQEAALQRQQAESIERGSHLYTSNCAVCHGPQGEGLVGPALKGTRLDENALRKIIARGIPGTAMSAWGKEDSGPLHQQNLGDLITFIKNWSQTVTATPEPVSTTTNTQKLYSTNCAACHGAKRQGVTGLGAALTPERLSALSDAELKTAILNGRPNTAMPPWKGILKPEEIDALVQLIKYTSP